MNRRHFIRTTAAVSSLPAAMSAMLSQERSVADTQNALIFKSRIKPISKEERSERIAQAQKLMEQSRMEAVIFEGGVSLNYFTGVSWGRSERLFAMVLPRKGNPVFIAPKFEESRAQEQVGGYPLMTWEEHEHPYSLIKQALKEMNALTGQIGIEETVRYFIAENLGITVSSAKFINATPVTAGCRSVKSEHEIELIQIANDITAEVFKASVPDLREGMTEREFGAIISKNFASFGVNGGALVLFGKASAHPHGLVEEHTLQENDIVLIDGGCTVEGYASDVTRTTVFGTPTMKMEKVFFAVLDAQTAALKFAKKGVPAETLDAAARRLITDSGFGPDYKYFTHRLGHGIGMEGHEWYYLVKGNKRSIVPGNIFTNEPGIYIVGEFGVRLEDELLITQNGGKLMLPQAQSLTKMFG